MDPPHKVRVCVIGAGIAGLGAAQRLVEAGVQDFVLLEAADRIGGRVCTIKHGEYPQKWMKIKWRYFYLLYVFFLSVFYL